MWLLNICTCMLLDLAETHKAFTYDYNLFIIIFYADALLYKITTIEPFMSSGEIVCFHIAMSTTEKHCQVYVRFFPISCSPTGSVCSIRWIFPPDRIFNYLQGNLLIKSTRKAKAWNGLGKVKPSVLLFTKWGYINNIFDWPLLGVI